ncbi:MAG: DUF1294 domain-containing protein [Methanimicrococcus sp.]|nr:DUF1294 domain-containing protein [Methanimicrococcus sp.]
MITITMASLTSDFALFAALYLALNILAFTAYGLDKAKASGGKWRISEKTLLILAFFGPFGAYAGMVICRHKTKKKPFTWAVPLFMLLHIVFCLIMFFS